MLLPHFGDARSESIFQRTLRVLRDQFGNADLSPYSGPFTTFWADLYQDKAYRIHCRKD